MTQRARDAVDEESGYLRRPGYVLHDRDTKFCADFRQILATGGVKCLRLPPRSPKSECLRERWVRSVNSKCLPISFCLVKAHCAAPRKTSANIITARGITKVREGEPAAVSSADSIEVDPGRRSMPGTAGWFAQVLSPERGLTWRSSSALPD
jgi:hypothetical protein